MTDFYLIRHGETGVRNRLSGRMPGIHLNAEGREQAARTAQRFTDLSIAAVYSSPLERAQETAECIAAVAERPVQVVEAVSEVDYGDCTRMRLDVLDEDTRWRHYNAFRSGVRIPGGENMIELQSRFTNWMEDVRQRYVGETIVVVSHQDPIKAAVAYYAGLHSDMFPRFHISPAATTVIRVDNNGAHLLTLNNGGALPR